MGVLLRDTSPSDARHSWPATQPSEARPVETTKTSQQQSEGSIVCQRKRREPLVDSSRRSQVEPMKGDKGRDTGLGRKEEMEVWSSERLVMSVSA